MDSSNPFEPTPEGLRTWLLKLPPDTREHLATFLVTAAARSTAAAIIDQAIVDQVRTSTYQEVADRHGWTKANVSRRLTRARNRKRTGSSPESPPAATMATSATQTPTTGPNPRERQRQPAFLAP